MHPETNNTHKLFIQKTIIEHLLSASSSELHSEAQENQTLLGGMKTKTLPLP